MARWKKGAKEFTVGVNYVEGRGASSSIPKPVIETLGNPKQITFLMKGKHVEVAAGDTQPEDERKVSSKKGSK